MWCVWLPPVRQSASRQAMNGARCDSATQATEESESEMKRKSKTTTAADTEQRRAELYMKKTPKNRPTIFELIFFVFLWSTSTGVISSFWCCWHNFRLTLDMCVCVMCAVTAVCGHASISHSRTIHEHGRRLRVYRYVCALGAWNCIYTMHDANEGMKKKKNARQKKTWYSMLAKIPAKPTTTTTTTEIHAQ